MKVKPGSQKNKSIIPISRSIAEFKTNASILDYSQFFIFECPCILSSVNLSEAVPYLRQAVELVALALGHSVESLVTLASLKDVIDLLRKKNKVLPIYFKSHKGRKDRVVFKPFMPVKMLEAMGGDNSIEFELLKWTKSVYCIFKSGKRRWHVLTPVDKRRRAHDTPVFPTVRKQVSYYKPMISSLARFQQFCQAIKPDDWSWIYNEDVVHHLIEPIAERWAEDVKNGVLNETTLKALSGYFNDAYMAINQDLRNGTNLSVFTQEIRQFFGYRESPYFVVLPEGMTLFRTLTLVPSVKKLHGPETIRYFKRFANLRKGHVIESASLVSTSLTPTFPCNFSFLDQKNVPSEIGFFVIHLPPGGRFFVVDSYLHPEVSYIPGEKEVILPPGTQLVATRDTQNATFRYTNEATLDVVHQVKIHIVYLEAITDPAAHAPPSHSPSSTALAEATTISPSINKLKTLQRALDVLFVIFLFSLAKPDRLSAYTNDEGDDSNKIMVY